jgi:hypothetical protein
MPGNGGLGRTERGPEGRFPMYIGIGALILIILLIILLT